MTSNYLNQVFIKCYWIKSLQFKLFLGVYIQFRSTCFIFPIIMNAALLPRRGSADFELSCGIYG